MRYQLFLLLFVSLFAVSCNNENRSSGNESGNASENAPARNPESSLGTEGTSKLMTVVADYYRLKDALVATDASEADVKANKLVSSADGLKNYINSDSSDGAALVPYLDTIKMGCINIVSKKDETTEYKRIHFEKVSDAMFALLKAADLKNAGVYRQYCPMAFNDKGAFWLSDVMDIKNPYFGKKMLECGEVTDSL